VFSGHRALTAGYRFLRWALITVEGTVAAAGRSGLGLIFLWATPYPSPGFDGWHPTVKCLFTITRGLDSIYAKPRQGAARFNLNGSELRRF